MICLILLVSSLLRSSGVFATMTSSHSSDPSAPHEPAVANLSKALIEDPLIPPPYATNNVLMPCCLNAAIRALAGPVFLIAPSPITIT